MLRYRIEFLFLENPSWVLSETLTRFRCLANHSVNIFSNTLPMIGVTEIGRHVPALAYEILPSFLRNIYFAARHTHEPVSRPPLYKCVSACIAISHNLLSIDGWRPALSKLFALHLYFLRARETSPSVIVSFKSLLVSSKPSKLFNFRSYRLLVLMTKSLSKPIDRLLFVLPTLNIVSSMFSPKVSVVPFGELIVAFLRSLRSSLSLYSFQFLFLRAAIPSVIGCPLQKLQKNLSFSDLTRNSKMSCGFFCAFGVYPHFAFIATYPLIVLLRVSTISARTFTDRGQSILSGSHFWLILSGAPTRVLPWSDLFCLPFFLSSAICLRSLLPNDTICQNVMTKKERSTNFFDGVQLVGHPRRIVPDTRVSRIFERDVWSRVVIPAKIEQSITI